MQINSSNGLGLACPIFGGLVALSFLVFWIWMLVDAINNPNLDGNMRLIWVLVIVLVGPLGALIYLFAGRNA